MRRIALGIALIAALAIAPAADAKRKKAPLRTYVYDVHLKGKGTYHRNDLEGDPSSWNRMTSQIADFSWKGKVSNVVLRGRKSFDVVSVGSTWASTKINVGESIRTEDPDRGWEQVDCGGEETGLEKGAATFGPPTVDEDLFVPLVDPKLDLVVRPFEKIDVVTECVFSGPAAEPGETHGGLVLTPVAGAFSAPIGSGVFDAAFDIPNEAMGFGKIIQKVEATPKQKEPVNCHDYGEGFTTRCDLRWSGTVTFHRRKTPMKG